MKKTITTIVTATLLSFVNTALAEENTRWRMSPDGGIEWVASGHSAHEDHIEMSGKRVSVVLRYGIDEKGAFTLDKSMVWPLLRTVPNDTHASLMRRLDWNPLDAVTVNGRTMRGEKVKDIRLKGMMTVESVYDGGRYGKCEVTREYLPSTELPALVEIYTIKNVGERPVTVEIPEADCKLRTDPGKGVTGSYVIEMSADKDGSFTVSPGEAISFGASIVAYRKGESKPSVDVETEKARRMALVDSWLENLRLETPDPVIDRMFAFSKIRACESIYETKGGPMHGPGGESYYAAIWANDQAEYVNPYFPFTGYDYGNASALNSFRHFARFMNDEWKPIPSSIIAEGLDIWNGAGDRGDAAMIAYGASRYALARGDREEARELWPLISWCLDYCDHKLDEAGVVASDSDELENRFPSGEANLCTSSLYYDALVSASYLARELRVGKPSAYLRRAATLRENIEKHFGSNVEGFETYAYYEGNDILRSWICIPLTMGIDEREEGTIEALFSPRLWTENGLLTQAGDKTFWDRSTLYALRGVYAVGETDKATGYLRRYSQSRLLGEHVPYAIEAWPEGGQRHLSAESGLYGRIITEGMFGIRPTGLASFTLTPRLPGDWDKMAMRNIRAFGSDFDIEVSRTDGGKLMVKVKDAAGSRTYPIKEGSSLSVKLR